MSENDSDSLDESLAFVEDRQGKSRFTSGFFAGSGVGLLFLFTFSSLLGGVRGAPVGRTIFIGIITLVAAGATINYHNRNRPYRFFLGAIVGFLIPVSLMFLSVLLRMVSTALH